MPKDVKVKLYPQVCESDCFGLFVSAMVKLQQFVISEPDEVHHQSRVAIQQGFRQTSLYSRHIMTSALHHD